MKKVITICIFLCFALTTFSQDSISTKTYVGLLNGAAYDVHNGAPSLSSSLRVGGSIVWQLGDKTSLHSFGVIDITRQSVTALQVYYVSYKPTKRWEIAVGHMPTLSTEQRGFPVSAGGHFETWTQTQIPGAALGGKIKYSFKDGLTIGVGANLRSQKGEYHGQISYKKLKLAGYTSAKRKGTSLSFSGKDFYSILVCNEKNIGNTSVITLVPKLSLQYWSDIGIDHTSNSLVRLEGGLLKNFKTKKCNGLVAIGYDAKITSVTAYLFVYL